MDWICGDATLNGVSVDTACTWLVPPSDLRTQFTDPTLMSTMVWGSVAPTTSAGSGAVAGFGIIVWSATPDDSVPTECPGPITECEYDWLYLHIYPMLPGTAVALFNGDNLDRRSQAKRRLGNDKGILLVAQSLVTTSNFHYHVRCLIKE